MTDKEYFSLEKQTEYITSSQIKTYLDCPDRLYAEIQGKYKKEKKDALILGSYIEESLTGNIETFTEENHSHIYGVRGNKLKPFIDADILVMQLKQDEKFMQLLSGENQKVFFGEIGGHKVMCKVDSLLGNMLVDLKYMKDFNGKYDPKEMRYKEWWEIYNYHLQMAFYQKILKQNGINVPAYLVAVTKEIVPDKGLFKFRQEILDQQVEKIRAIIDDVVAAKNGMGLTSCGSCDYCKSQKNFSNIKEVLL